MLNNLTLYNHAVDIMNSGSSFKLPPPLSTPYRSLAALITGRYFEDVLIGAERTEYSVVAKNVERIGYRALRASHWFPLHDCFVIV